MCLQATTTLVVVLLLATTTTVYRGYDKIQLLLPFFSYPLLLYYAYMQGSMSRSVGEKDDGKL